MEKIPTAEKFIEQLKSEFPQDAKMSAKKWIAEVARRFAKLHVKAALEAAYNNSKIIDDPSSYTGNTGSEYQPDQIVDEKSILMAYLEENIK